MARVMFKVNLATVMDGLRVRKERAYVAANAGAVIIAQRSNDELIPQVYPGAVAKALVAEASPASAAARLYAVRFIKKDELFRWYEWGTPEHIEQPINASALHFLWEKLGEEVFLDRVDNPGYEGRHHLPGLMVAVGMVARDTWGSLLGDAMKL